MAVRALPIMIPSSLISAIANSFVCAKLTIVDVRRLLERFIRIEQFFQQNFQSFLQLIEKRYGVIDILPVFHQAESEFILKEVQAIDEFRSDLV